MGKLFTRIILISSIFFWACDDPFSFSPFEVNVPENFRNITRRNLELIAANDTASSEPFKVALISDSHYHFEELEAAINHINQRIDISFIIVTGDISENGLQKEFELFHTRMVRARVPYLTVIGNHDHLSNGAEVYKQMFGPLNYTFTFHNTKFIMWDNVAWESRKAPDWSWFKNQLTETSEEHSTNESNQIIPVSHIPPDDLQVCDSLSRYQQLLRDHNIQMSVHGHMHEYSNRRLDGTNAQCITIGSPQKHNYAVLTISDSVTCEKVEY